MVFLIRLERMSEAELFYVEAVYEGVDGPDRVFFVDVSFEYVGEEGCLVSVQAFYVFAHGFSTAVSVAVKPV